MLIARASAVIVTAPLPRAFDTVTRLVTAARAAGIGYRQTPRPARRTDRLTAVCQRGRCHAGSQRCAAAAAAKFLISFIVPSPLGPLMAKEVGGRRCYATLGIGSASGDRGTGV